MNRNNSGFNGFPTNNFSPFGINDNNFNRQNFPSNMSDEKYYNGNPSSAFNSMTTNHPNLNKFPNAYKVNQPIIETIDYNNYNELIHNNVAQEVLDEHIVEYRINIDSSDRDIAVYPDPFCFKVKFNPLSDSTVRTEIIKNGKNVPINQRMKGAPRPHINRDFKNVKYIKLDNIVLPQFSNIEQNEDGEYELVRDSFLLDDRYVALVIKELDCNRVYDTSDGSNRIDDNGNINVPPRPFAHIFPDKLLGRYYYVGTPYYGSKIYTNSLLGNINNLTIEFYDSCGSKLKFNNLFTYEQLLQAENCEEALPITDYRHPLNKKIQVHLSFIIGVVESQINTNTKFDN